MIYKAGKAGVLLHYFSKNGFKKSFASQKLENRMMKFPLGEKVFGLFSTLFAVLFGRLKFICTTRYLRYALSIWLKKLLNVFKKLEISLKTFITVKYFFEQADT